MKGLSAEQSKSPFQGFQYSQKKNGLTNTKNELVLLNMTIIGTCSLYLLAKAMDMGLLLKIILFQNKYD